MIWLLAAWILAFVGAIGLFVYAAFDGQRTEGRGPLPGETFLSDAFKEPRG